MGIKTKSNSTKKTEQLQVLQQVLLDPSNGTLEAQLVSLYTEKKKLQEELGVSDADGIIAMVRSMEEQLILLYGRRAGKRS